MDDLSAKIHREITSHTVLDTDDEILLRKPKFSLKSLRPQQS
jgi:hypothetical protein